VNRRQILKIIGANIRKARLTAGFTQESLAEILGIHWKTVGYIEAGKRDFGASILTMIILRLKLPPDALTEGMPPVQGIGLILRATRRKRKGPTSSGA
jgi:DNA-binding XRE family transcriptional regulator